MTRNESKEESLKLAKEHLLAYAKQLQTLKPNPENRKKLLIESARQHLAELQSNIPNTPGEIWQRYLLLKALEELLEQEDKKEKLSEEDEKFLTDKEKFFAEHERNLLAIYGSNFVPSPSESAKQSENVDSTTEARAVKINTFFLSERAPTDPSPSTGKTGNFLNGSTTFEVDGTMVTVYSEGVHREMTMELKPDATDEQKAKFERACEAHRDYTERCKEEGGYDLFRRNCVGGVAETLHGLDPERFSKDTRMPWMLDLEVERAYQASVKAEKKASASESEAPSPKPASTSAKDDEEATKSKKDDPAAATADGLKTDAAGERAPAESAFDDALGHDRAPTPKPES